MAKITKIKILRNTRAGGESLGEGKTYTVPKEVSVKDAEILIKMRSAESVCQKKAAEKKSDDK